MNLSTLKCLVFNKARAIDFLLMILILLYMVVSPILLSDMPSKAFAGIALFPVILIMAILSGYFLSKPIDYHLQYKLERQSWSLAKRLLSQKEWGPFFIEYSLRYLLLRTEDEILIVNYVTKERVKAKYLGSLNTVKTMHYNNFEKIELGYKGYRFKPYVVLLNGKVAIIPRLAIVKLYKSID